MSKSLCLMFILLVLGACSSKDNTTMGGGTQPVVTNPQIPAPSPMPAPNPVPVPLPLPPQPITLHMPFSGLLSLQIVQESIQGQEHFRVWSWNTCVRNGVIMQKRLSTQGGQIQNISPLLSVKIDVNLEGKILPHFHGQKGLVKAVLDIVVRDHHFNQVRQNQISFIQSEDFRRVERLTLPQIPRGYKLIVESRPFIKNGLHQVNNEQVYQQCLDTLN